MMISYNIQPKFRNLSYFHTPLLQQTTPYNQCQLPWNYVTEKKPSVYPITNYRQSHLPLANCNLRNPQGLSTHLEEKIMIFCMHSASLSRVISQMPNCTSFDFSSFPALHQRAVVVSSQTGNGSLRSSCHERHPRFYYLVLIKVT